MDVLGRMGTFGLGVMKTKADRMWDEFGVNAAARLGRAPTAAPAAVAVEAVAQASVPAARAVEVPAMAEPQQPTVAQGGATSPAVPARATQRTGFWARLLGGPSAATGQDIRVEVRRGDTTITVHWPVQASQDCAAWLRTLV